jgi:integrase
MKATASRTKIGPNLYQRGKRFYLIANVNGTQVLEPIPETTITGAKIWRDKRMGQLRARDAAPLADRSLTFNALVDLWIASEEDPTTRTLKASTLCTRKTLLASHVQPLLGKKKVVNLTVFDARTVLETAKRKGLSGSSVKAVIRSLKCVLDYGAIKGKAEKNVARELVPSEIPSGARETEPIYLTLAGVRAFFAALKESAFLVIGQTCFYGALRISEALSLTWADVDFDRSLIWIRQGKTKASIAPVPLRPELEEVLQAHRASQGALGFDRIKDDSLVFQTATGQPQGRRNVLRAFHTASTKAGLDVTQIRERDGKEIVTHVSCHDLRHSAATLLNEDGADLETISSFLRHASTAVTEAIYIGKLKTPEERAQNVGAKIAALYEGAS